MIPSNNATPSSPSSIVSDATTTDYLSIHDLHHLFFRHTPNDIKPLLYSLYQQYPQHFYHDQRRICYVAKHHVVDLARSLQLFALAEFCVLSHDELVHRVADPLFAITNSMMLRPVTPKRMDIDLDWFPLPSNDNSFFSSIFNSAAYFENSDHAATQVSNPACATLRHHHDRPISFFPTLKSYHDWTRHFLPLQNAGLGCASRAKQQQQAIIECRMRSLVYRQSLPAAIQQRHQQQQQPKRQSPSKSSSPVNTNSIATNTVPFSAPVHQQHLHMKRKSAPPSPPQHLKDHYASHHRQNQHYHHHQPSISADYRGQKRLKSLYSNLDLLATQATKLKGLPLSPEISPPPPPASHSVLSLPPITTTSTSSVSSFYSSSFMQSISLPSIRNVLSDI
ncbi:hypothetical protein [Absidia glauca]|uniref:Uncharacterized protein n=1 Tax=Absidia glauca TaxID=4829 RepID=A0A163MHS4_ABSGL|nr:hypothetical protein [Absidia glauca]